MSANDLSEMSTSLNFPESQETCIVSIINTTCDLTVPSELLVEPMIKGHEWLNLPTYSFHIKNKRTGRQILFDLGARKDWENSPPTIADVIANHIPGMKVQSDVIDILQDGGVELKSIEALVLSHFHFDHCGDPAALPRSIDLIVGPGFRDSYLPGWPSNATSTFHEAAFEGRNVLEVPFSDEFKIGRFRAHDYFGDGSFFLLSVPGHTVEHICGLVRDTKDTFVFLGGDAGHFGGNFRPTKAMPLPLQIPQETPLDIKIPRPCPCSAFTICHPIQSDSRTTPFYKVGTGPKSWYDNPPLAQESLKGVEEFDADTRILVAIAHDPTALRVFTFFPDGTMNGWERKGWKKALHWGFLNELPYDGHPGQSKLVDGLYKGGEKIKDVLA